MRKLDNKINKIIKKVILIGLDVDNTAQFAYEWSLV